LSLENKKIYVVIILPFIFKPDLVYQQKMNPMDDFSASDLCSQKVARLSFLLSTYQKYLLRAIKYE
jgi:hypothetical protein